MIFRFFARSFPIRSSSDDRPASEKPAPEEVGENIEDLKDELSSLEAKIEALTEQFNDVVRPQRFVEFYEVLEVAELPV